jgi:hypothetical protein
VNGDQKLSTVKSGEVNVKEGQSREQELLDLTAELAKINVEPDKTRSTSGNEEEGEQSHSDKEMRLQEMRQKLDRIKSTKDDLAWNKVDAELVRAQQRLDNPALERQRGVAQGGGDLASERGPARSDRGGRAEAIFSPQLPGDIRDTGIRRRTSVRMDDDGMSAHSLYVGQA